jgi:hypothetical protein
MTGFEQFDEAPPHHDDNGVLLCSTRVCSVKAAATRVLQSAPFDGQSGAMLGATVPGAYRVARERRGR